MCRKCYPDKRLLIQTGRRSLRRSPVPPLPLKWRGSHKRCFWWWGRLANVITTLYQPSGHMQNILITPITTQQAQFGR